MHEATLLSQVARGATVPQSADRLRLGRVVMQREKTLHTRGRHRHELRFTPVNRVIYQESSMVATDDLVREEPLRSVTHHSQEQPPFDVLANGGLVLSDGTFLIQTNPETGRTSHDYLLPGADRFEQYATDVRLLADGRVVVGISRKEDRIARQCDFYCLDLSHYEQAHPLKPFLSFPGFAIDTVTLGANRIAIARNQNQRSLISIHDSNFTSAQEVSLSIGKVVQLLDGADGQLFFLNEDGVFGQVTADSSDRNNPKISYPRIVGVNGQNYPHNFRVIENGPENTLIAVETDGSKGDVKIPDKITILRKDGENNWRVVDSQSFFNKSVRIRDIGWDSRSNEPKIFVLAGTNEPANDESTLYTIDIDGK